MLDALVYSSTHVPSGDKICLSGCDVLQPPPSSCSGHVTTTQSYYL